MLRSTQFISSVLMNISTLQPPHTSNIIAAYLIPLTVTIPTLTLTSSTLILTHTLSIGAEMLADDSKYAAIPAWTESTRDFMNFSKRKGDLPVQLDGDAMDIRGRGYTGSISSYLLLISPSSACPYHIIGYLVSCIHRHMTSTPSFVSYHSSRHIDFSQPPLFLTPYFFLSFTHPQILPLLLFPLIVHSTLCTGMMHRDGSVFSSVSLNDLKNPDTLYRALGEGCAVIAAVALLPLSLNFQYYWYSPTQSPCLVILCAANVKIFFLAILSICSVIVLKNVGY